MKRCPQCELRIAGELDRCPLCGCGLEGSPVPSVFPENRLARPKRLARRWLLAITVACLALVVALGVIAHASVLTVCAGCAAVLVNYAFVRNIVVHAPGFLRVMERYFLVLMAVALLILLATGSTGMATFVVPMLCLFALLTNMVLVAVFRSPFVKGYAKYLVFDLVLGLVPLVLLAVGLVTWPVLAIASAVLDVVLLALMLILTRSQFVSETQKLFNA